jgi:hypothetical protein
MKKRCYNKKGEREKSFIQLFLDILPVNVFGVGSVLAIAVSRKLTGNKK